MLILVRIRVGDTVSCILFIGYSELGGVRVVGEG
jgi:hypothetical protein